MSQIVHLQHNDADTKSVLERAAAIVAELELDGDLKVPAFDKAVDLLAGTHLVVNVDAPGLIGQRSPLLA